MSLQDELLSSENLKEYFSDATDSITDAQIRSYIAESLTDEAITEMLVDPIDEAIQEKVDEGVLTADQAAEKRAQLQAIVVTPEKIAQTRELILNNPETINQVREGMQNPSPEQLQQLRKDIKESMDSSVKFQAAQGLLHAVENGAIDAGFWGLASTGQFAVATGSTSKFAGLMSFGKKVPYVGAAVAIVIEGGMAAKHFADGENEKGSIALGGAAGGAAATLAAGAATVGVLVTAPGWVPLAAAGAIGVAGYYIGRGVGEIGYGIADTVSIYNNIDEMDATQVDRFYQILGGSIPRVLGDRDASRRLERAGALVDPESGQVTFHTLAVSLGNPEMRNSVKRELCALMEEKKAEFADTMYKHSSIAPRWMRWGDSVCKYSAAKSDHTMMTDALDELDGWCEGHVERYESAQNKITEALADFNNLDKDLQAVIVMSVEANYQAYMDTVPEGTKAMSHDDYMIAGKIAATQNEQLVSQLTAGIAEVKRLSDLELEKWQSNPDGYDANLLAKAEIFAAGQEVNDAIMMQVIKDALLTESFNNPATFQQRVASFAPTQSVDAKASDAQVAASDVPVKSETAAPETSAQILCASTVVMKDDISESFNALVESSDPVTGYIYNAISGLMAEFSPQAQERFQEWALDNTEAEQRHDTLVKAGDNNELVNLRGRDPYGFEARDPKVGYEYTTAS